MADNRFIGSDRDMWAWSDAPITPPDSKIDGTNCRAVPSNYLRQRDGRLQQLWVYYDSAGHAQAAEWIGVDG